MDVQVAKTTPCGATVTLSVTAQEFDTAFKKDLSRVGKQARLKGFRPGKVPAQVIQQMYGESIERETIEGFLRQGLDKAIADESLELAMQPRIDMEAIGFERGKDLSVTVELDLKPEFDIANYKGLEVEHQEVVLEDGEVEKTIEDVRRQQASPSPAGDAGLPAENGMAVGRIELHHDGSEVAARDGLRLSVEFPPNGVDEAAWKKAVVGAKEGDTIEVPLTFPDDWEQEELRGKDGTCKVTFSQVFALELPAREDLYKQFGVEDDEAFVAKVTEQLMAAKEQNERNRVENALFDQIIAANPFDLPARMLESQVETRLGQMAQEMVQQGLPEEDARAQAETNRAAAAEQAEKSLRAYFLVEKISLAEDLQVQKSEMTAELRRIAMRNRATYEQVAQYYQEQKLMPQLGIEIMERKVRTFLRENAAGAEATSAK
ncbi:Trigger factor [Planctomycetes bacterium Pla163]|uniref:Trigger factor n=1 Tax=Rohdeia mirabilis TaxID=2528008 RepID=A0A518D1E0_9BACT|nr:Trigger factor [Planctomycetes bacterium Pla163]